MSIIFVYISVLSFCFFFFSFSLFQTRSVVAVETLYRVPLDKHGHYLECFTKAGQSFESIIRDDSPQLHAGIFLFPVYK